MKKIVSLLAFLLLALSAFAQRSVFGIAQEIGKSEIVLDESAPPVPGIADAARAFCTKYSGNSMTLGRNHNLSMFGLIKFAGKGE